MRDGFCSGNIAPPFHVNSCLQTALQIYWMTWWKAENVLTVAQYLHRCGDATARVTFSATPVVFTAK